MSKQDLYGCELTVSSQAALDMWNETVSSFVANSPSTGVNLGLTLEIEPELAIAHACKGLISLVSGNDELVATSREALACAKASDRENPVTAEERCFIDALAAWLNGDVETTLSQLETLVIRSPHNKFAKKLHHATMLVIADTHNMKAA